MKKFIPILLFITVLSSCVKIGETPFFKYLDQYGYFHAYQNNVTLEKTFSLLSDTLQKVNATGTYNPNSNYYHFIFGYIMPNSQYFANSNGISRENYFVKFYKKDFKLYIEENHLEVVRNTKSYNVEIEKYELDIMKKDLKLNDAWVSKSTLIANFKNQYYYYSFTEKYNVMFKYEVIGFDETKVYNKKTYENVISVRVNYKIGTDIETFRIFSFTERYGLVSVSNEETVHYLSKTNF